MPHADSALRELSSFGTDVDLPFPPGTLTRGCCAGRTAIAKPGAAGALKGSGSRALVPRQGGAAGHGQFGLVYQVAGAGASYDSYRDELVQAGALGQSDQPAYEYMAGSGNMGQTC